MKVSLAMGDDALKMNTEQQGRRKKCDEILDRLDSVRKSKGLKKLG